MQKIIRHKVGDKVVSLTTRTEFNGQPRVKGQVYEVLNTRFCTCCGEQTINIEPTLSGLTKSRCTCGNITHTKLWWTRSTHFANLNNLEENIAEAVETEDYETAAMLDKFKAVCG